MTLPAGIAAGHPATAEAGLEILRAGGSAADAAVAASLASCVAETVMTGLLGGGFALHVERGQDPSELRPLDFFCTVPGLGGRSRAPEVTRLAVPFGEELVHYAVGAATCAVPGVPAGLEALWSDHGRLEWPRLVEPALRLARSNVSMPPAHVACLEMLDPVFALNDGARIYAPAGRLLRAGEELCQPGLVAALELVAREGALTFYEGTIAERLLDVMEARGGLVTREDLAAFAPDVSAPARTRWSAADVVSRADAIASPLRMLERLPPLREASPGERALALVRALESVAVESHTTNVTAADSDGNVCVITTSLGLGAGEWIPGLDLHLNSMLGEVELLVDELVPGQRMRSMMSPLAAFAPDGGVLLAAGAAGGSRLPGALVQVLAGIVDEGLEPQAAVARPRLHPIGGVVHAEPGHDERALAALEQEGYEVRRWPALHHYFGGVSLIARSGGAADPRRSGCALSAA